MDWVSSVQYGPANEMTSLTSVDVYTDNSPNPPTFNYRTETRQYNIRLQLTRVTVPGVMDLEYRFSATQNNGKITQSKDWVSGEEVSYTYDSLQRLIAASTTGPEWGLSFSYDGFGNRTGQTVTKGSGPASSVTVDPNTNRITNYGYDANGNMVTNPASAGGSLSYDVENRVMTVQPNAGGAEMYAYTGDNKRVYKRLPDGTEEYYFYGVDGRKLGTYSVVLAAYRRT